MREKYYLKADGKTFLYPDDALKILKLASPKQEYNLRFMLGTGGRINEIRNVKRSDLDMERENINLRITKVRAKLKETRSTQRNIPVDSKTFRHIRLNINKFKIYSTSHYDKMLKKLAREANVKYYKDLSSHNMRKTFGTWMMALNVSIDKLSTHLGNSAEMLRKRYASPDIFNLRDKDIMREILGNLPNRMING